MFQLPPLDWVLSPWGMAVLGLLVGSFLNVVVHRLPIMLERQWWGDVVSQLRDRDSFRRTFDAEAPPGTGSRTLADHYAALLRGEAVHERGEHAVF